METKAFHGTDIVKIADAPPPDTAPLVVGDECWLTSDTSELPPMMVMECDDENVVCGLPTGEEWTMPRVCVRRTVIGL